MVKSGWLQFRLYGGYVVTLENVYSSWTAIPILWVFPSVGRILSVTFIHGFVMLNGLMILVNG